MANGSKLGQQSVTLPTGDTTARPAAPAQGETRYNTLLNQVETWNGSTWIALGVTAGAFYLNNNTVAANYTIPANQNALSAGPVTINDGITVTISDGSVWTIV